MPLNLNLHKMLRNKEFEILRILIKLKQHVSLTAYLFFDNLLLFLNVSDNK